MFIKLNNNEIKKCYEVSFLDNIHKNYLYYFIKPSWDYLSYASIFYNIKTKKYDNDYDNDYKIKYFVKLTSKLIKI